MPFFAEEGIERWISEGRMTLWKTDHFIFALAVPSDGKRASSGNGPMVGFQVDSTDTVERMHATAFRLDVTDEGAPEIRSGGTAACVQDLDGNNLCFLTSLVHGKRPHYTQHHGLITRPL